MEIYAELFKALAHPIRLKIVCGLMTKDECNVSLMVEKLGVPQPTVSQHLNILKNAGIITGDKKGTQICYKITDEKTKKIISSLEIELCEQ
jgi:ArsR family transcriptional regulator